MLLLMSDRLNQPGMQNVILPEDSPYLERYDALSEPVAGWYEQYVSLRQPLVKRVYNTRPGWWIAKELGKRLDCLHIIRMKIMKKLLNTN